MTSFLQNAFLGWIWYTLFFAKFTIPMPHRIIQNRKSNNLSAKRPSTWQTFSSSNLSFSVKDLTINTLQYYVAHFNTC